jgi:hypothetical protein
MRRKQKTAICDLNNLTQNLMRDTSLFRRSIFEKRGGTWETGVPSDSGKMHEGPIRHFRSKGRKTATDVIDAPQQNCLRLFCLMPVKRGEKKINLNT